MIQEEEEEEQEALTLLLVLENRSIKSKILLHTALIFKEQTKVKERGLREEELEQPHYSIQHIEGFNLLC
jgi:hypothetical protein